MRKSFNVIGKIVSIILFLCSIIFDFILVWSNILPLKYSDLTQTVDLLKNMQKTEKVIENYYVVTTKDKCTPINKLKNKKVGTFVEDLEMYENAISKIKEQITIELVEYDSIETMLNDLEENKIEAMILSEAHKGILEEEITDFSNTICLVEEVKVSSDIVDIQENASISVKDQPMIIYVSGMDSFGNISARGRSDVNMIITLNPITHEILLTSIPRDYYVQLYGTTGYKDKLTHAGFYGIDNSINTIENFMGIKFDAYIKINFSLIVGVVDAIGGVDVYSDKSFTPWTNRKVYITKGVNHMDGAKALAFARERMTYTTGDRHRVQNQQDVVAAIIKKITTSEVLLTKYTDILNSVAGTFETNIDMDHVTDMVKLQLDTFPSWTVKTYNLNGYDHSGYTHTFGNQLLYVMNPDERTIVQAKIFIDGMLEGKTFAELGL